MAPRCLFTCLSRFGGSTHDQMCCRALWIPQFHVYKIFWKSTCLLWVIRSGMSSTGSQFLVLAGSLGNLTFSGHYYR